MNNNQNYISVLDIGSSKICCLIAERDSNGFNKVIGLGHIASEGIKASIITDFSLAIKCISKALKTAEKQANIFDTIFIPICKKAHANHMLMVLVPPSN